MAANSKIQWTHATFNMWRGCTKISAGCKNCYAETMSHRNPGVLGVWGREGTRAIATESYWRQPAKWNRDAEKTGRRRRVFCASLADVFEGPDTMPDGYGIDAAHLGLSPNTCTPTLNNDSVSAARERLFELTLETPWLDWLLLTKRPQNVIPLFGTWLHFGGLSGRLDAAGRVSHEPLAWPANVWVGISVEDQENMEKRGPYIEAIRAAGCPVVFLSAEPLLGFIDMRPWLGGPRGANWVIIGGESGAHAREFSPLWAEGILDQCREAGTPAFFKQMGENVAGQTLKLRHKGGDWDDIPERLRVREFPEVAT